MRLDGGVTDGDRRQGSWAVVLPVKGLSDAKTRLAGSDLGTADLAFAFFQDAATAALDCPAVGMVIVTTSDPVIAGWGRDHGCVVVSDEGQAGINAAAAHAAHAAHAAPATLEAGDAGLAVMVSDLPAVTPSAIAAALTLAAAHPVAFLTDLEGTGTTMWMSEPAAAVRTAFGPLSRQAHRDLGAADLVAIHGDLASLRAARRDVDTVDDLEQARAFGLGAHTLAALTAGDGA